MEHPQHESEERGLPLQHVLTDTSDRRAAIIWMVIAVVILAVLAGIGFGADDPSTVWMVILAVAAVVAIGAAWWKVRVWAGWSNPQLFLPSSDPLQLGDHVIIRFRRTARGRSDATGLVVTAQVRVEERATYRQGTDTTTATETVYTQDVDVVLNDLVNRTVEVDLGIDVPLFEAPPTMDLGNNEVRWELVVDMAAPNAPDDESTFPLEVAPVVAQRLHGGGGGS